jgi:hypothetical protein
VGAATLTSVFGGADPNGEWQLYIVDDADADMGSLAGGWSLTLTTRQEVCVTFPCALRITNNTAAAEPGSCGAVVNYGIEIAGSCGIVTGSPASGSVFPVGSTPVALVGTRQDGSRSEFTGEVIVSGAGLPVITDASASPSVLWSPNHEMADVTVSYTLGNTCTGSGLARTTLSVQSNEPINGTGDGDTAPDWEVIDSHHVRLRRERAGGGTGRIYTITITATDAAGNVTTAQVLVVVPHDG